MQKSWAPPMGWFLRWDVVLRGQTKGKLFKHLLSLVFPSPARSPVSGGMTPACQLQKTPLAEQVRKHFSDLYSLVTPGPSYPFLGVSSTGVGIFWGCTLGLLFGLLVSLRALCVRWWGHAKKQWAPGWSAPLLIAHRDPPHPATVAEKG